MVDAVKRARVANMVCHNYRRVPAIALARQMIDGGEIGDRIYHFRARYAQDWIADENFPLVWRLQSKIAGSGALGDIGAHIIDLARFLVGEIAGISAVSETFVKRRLTKNRQFARVDVDDAVSVIGKFRNGAMLNLEATRFARGRKNQLTFEINGSRGSLAFDLEEMNRLRFYDATDPEHDARISRHHRYGIEPSIRRKLVAARPSHWLRAFLRAHRRRLCESRYRSQKDRARFRRRIEDAARPRCHPTRPTFVLAVIEVN